MVDSYSTRCVIYELHVKRYSLTNHGHLPTQYEQGYRAIKQIQGL